MSLTRFLFFSLQLLLVSAMLASAMAQYQSIPPPPTYGGVHQILPHRNQHVQPQPHDSVPDYSYGYGVNDPVSGVHNTKEETRLGDRTEGSYSTILPDGRRQIVTYWVDGKSGYNAQVTYEGVAHHDAPVVPKPRPVHRQPVFPRRSYDPYGSVPIF